MKVRKHSLRARAKSIARLHSHRRARSGSTVQNFPLDTLARPLRDLRISVTDRCNFRCTYCMPREIFGPGFAYLPKADVLNFEEIARLARIFVSLGVEKIRLTGGEPLLRRNLDRLVAALATIDGLRDITLTTNGPRRGVRVLLPRAASRSS